MHLFSRRRRTRGFAMATVIIMGMMLLGFISIVFFNTRAQKVTQVVLLDQAKAELGAKAILNLAIYKFRLLSSKYEDVINASSTAKPFFQNAWLADFNSKISTSPASVMCERMGCNEMGISSFTKIIPTGSAIDFSRDILRIEGYAICNGKKRTLEQMVELKLAESP